MTFNTGYLYNRQVTCLPSDDEFSWSLPLIMGCRSTTDNSIWLNENVSWSYKRLWKKTTITSHINLLCARKERESFKKLQYFTKVSNKMSSVQKFPQVECSSLRQNMCDISAEKQSSTACEQYVETHILLCYISSWNALELIFQDLKRSIVSELLLGNIPYLLPHVVKLTCGLGKPTNPSLCMGATWKV